MFCKAIALPSLNLQLIPLLVGMTWDFTIEPFSGTLKSSHFLDGTNLICNFLDILHFTYLVVNEYLINICKDKCIAL